MYTLIAVIVAIVMTMLIMGYFRGYPMPRYYETFYVPHHNYYPDQYGRIRLD
jgi:hypothetical protein